MIEMAQFHPCELCEHGEDRQHPILDAPTDDESIFYVVAGFVFCERHYRELIGFIRKWLELHKKSKHDLKRNLRANPDDPDPEVF